MNKARPCINKEEEFLVDKGIPGKVTCMIDFLRKMLTNGETIGSEGSN